MARYLSVRADLAVRLTWLYGLGFPALVVGLFSVRAVVDYVGEWLAEALGMTVDLSTISCAARHGLWCFSPAESACHSQTD